MYAVSASSMARSARPSSMASAVGSRPALFVVSAMTFVRRCVYATVNAWPIWPQGPPPIPVVSTTFVGATGLGGVEHAPATATASVTDSSVVEPAAGRRVTRLRLPPRYVVTGATICHLPPPAPRYSCGHSRRFGGHNNYFCGACLRPAPAAHM